MIYRYRLLLLVLPVVMLIPLYGVDNKDSTSSTCDIAHGDRYLETPEVITLPQTRMKPIISASRAVIEEGFSSIDRKEFYLLAKMIECEARYEPYEGKVAVGVVILNRVKSRRFPDTIREVIFQKGQFQPIVDGGWQSKEPSALAFRAAQDALEGKIPVGNNGKSVEDALFFIYEDLASEKGIRWFKENLRYITTIGNHDFYKY